MNPAKPQYVAYTAGACLEKADSLHQLRNALQAAWPDDRDEDVCCWRIDERGRAHAELVLRADGSQLEMKSYCLTWRWPPKQK
jgi:hypothetical protein